MFGISFTEILVIAVVALIVIGPQQLPEVLSAIGKLVGMIRREFDVVRRDFRNSVYTPASEVKSRLDAASSELIEPPVESKPAEKSEEHNGHAG